MTTYEDPRRRNFRALLASSLCVTPASVFDAISARAAEHAGFTTAILPGSLASAAVLAAPDVGVLTLSDLASQTRRICRVSALSLLVDADHGYGNAFNVGRTIAELETAGASAITIEDTLLPPAFGAQGKGALVSRGEGVGKVRAALLARRDPNLIIVARTSAPAFTDLDDALERAAAYAQAGADALFLVGLRTIDQLKQVRDRIRLPIMLGLAGPELQAAGVLAELGVRLLIRKHVSLLAALQALHDVYRDQRAGLEITQTRLAGAALVDAITQAERYV